MKNNKCNFNYRLLRGRIVTECETIGDFAKEFGCSRTLISNKLNNRLKFSTDDIVKICEILNIPRDEIGMYFFTKAD